jgi:hypothetical protein
MKMQLAALSLFALVGCASTGAVAQDAPCSWASATWNTGGNTGDALVEAPLTLRVVTPSGDIEGTWGDPVAGEVWGRIVGPDENTIVGEWGTRRATGADGAFLLQLSAPLPDRPESCRFEGVYTAGAGQAPLGWFGERRRLTE